MDQRNMEHSLRRRIETLINAWGDLQDKQRQLDEFPEKYSRPEPPAKFESVGALVEYNQQKKRYEQHLGGYEDRVKRSRQVFDGQAGPIMPYLPEGIPLIHTYQMHGATYADVGSTYEIMKVVSEEGQPSIQIRKLDGES